MNVLPANGLDEPINALINSAHISAQANTNVVSVTLLDVADADAVSVNCTVCPWLTVKLHELDDGLTLIDKPAGIDELPTVPPILKYVGVHDEPQLELITPEIVNWILLLVSELSVYELTVMEMMVMNLVTLMRLYHLIV